MTISITRETIKKFDVVGPRYTSYPTAPQWTNEFDQNSYITKLQRFAKTDKSLSLYIHIPFCQSMCTYCGCNVIIRPQENKYGDEYVSYLEKEIDLLTKHIGQDRKIKQFHWGGGTPTYLNNEQIKRLFTKVQNSFDLDQDAEIAIEIDPRTIDLPKVKLLKELGFNRISMGVQDFDHNVQEEINRVQSFEIVKEFYDYCRELNFSSVNFDLIYGLPKQTQESFIDTVDQVIALKPDRIALYSFAFVPWLKKHQNKINQEHLPNSDDKLDIFLQSRNKFLASGYEAIAMDHFALSKDEMAKAFNENRLYRNFMGYTTKPADEFIGIGLTSIGFLEESFIQNTKLINEYYAMLDEGKLPVERGLNLSKDDVIRQWLISQIMCHFELNKKQFSEQFNVSFDEYFKAEEQHIKNCVNDGLLEEKDGIISVTELGKLFVRNICMGFDVYLKQKSGEQRYSRTI